MKKITSTAELKESIFLLEMKQANETTLLKEQFKITYESLRPVNLVKNTIRELVTTTDFKGGLLNTTLSLTAGYLTKKIVVGSTHNPLKKILGSLLQMSVTNIASKNTDGIRSMIGQLINTLFKKDQCANETRS